MKKINFDFRRYDLTIIEEFIYLNKINDYTLIVTNKKSNKQTRYKILHIFLKDKLMLLQQIRNLNINDLVLFSIPNCVLNNFLKKEDKSNESI